MLDIDLFEKLENSEVLELLKCMGIKTKVFKKGSNIVKYDSKIDFLGVILAGNAQIYKTDITGKRVLLEDLKINDIFGHNIVCLGQISSSAYKKFDENDIKKKSPFNG